MALGDTAGQPDETPPLCRDGAWPSRLPEPALSGRSPSRTFFGSATAGQGYIVSPPHTGWIENEETGELWSLRVLRIER